MPTAPRPQIIIQKRGDDERKTFLGGGEGTPFLLGINRRWFEHTAKRLRTRKYPFKPARQVNIPKPGKLKETRLLAMIGLIAVIIQNLDLFFLKPTTCLTPPKT
jgi:hypothetical protein